MHQIILSELLIYPVKSTCGLPRKESRVYAEGLEHDRRWAVTDEQGTVLTAREYPQLLDVKTTIETDTLHLMLDGCTPLVIALKPAEDNLVEATIFDTPVLGNRLSPQADRLLSDYLGTSCRLIFMDEHCHRYVMPKHGGLPGDKVSYADTAPLLLTSTASLQTLNSMLLHSISMNNFRPNIVVAGCGANEEDTWKRIRIGDVVFDVTETCKRCVVTTIDPVTKIKHKEPLRTLATYKRHPRGGVSFGINLIPRTAGIIKQGDPVDVVSS